VKTERFLTDAILDDAEQRANDLDNLEHPEGSDEAARIRKGIAEIRAALDMPDKPTVRNIVATWLRAHGYSALCGDECGCGIDDLFPCDGEGVALDCEAGYWRKGTEQECYEVDQPPESYIASLDKEQPDG